MTASANVKDPQTFNRYSYAMNSPYKFADPLGLVGEYYNTSGGYIGSDGKPDGKIYFAESAPDGEDGETNVWTDSIRQTTQDAVDQARRFYEADTVTLTSTTVSELTRAIGFNVQAGARIQGTLKGVANTIPETINGVGALATGAINLATGSDISAPKVPMILEYNGSLEASYGSASAAGTSIALGGAASTFSNSSTIGVATFRVKSNPITKAAVHGNSLDSQRPTWFYKLYAENGTFLKNGITSNPVPQKRYTKAFMSDKYMDDLQKFPNRRQAYEFEYQQNVVSRGPLNKNIH